MRIVFTHQNHLTPGNLGKGKGGTLLGPSFMFPCLFVFLLLSRVGRTIPVDFFFSIFQMTVPLRCPSCPCRPVHSTSLTDSSNILCVTMFLNIIRYDLWGFRGEYGLSLLGRRKNKASAWSVLIQANTFNYLSRVRSHTDYSVVARIRL